MPTTSPRVLFVLKFRESPWGDYSGAAEVTAASTDPTAPKKGLSSGLLNSATFVHKMLEAKGVETKLVQVLDNNYIDREVAAFKPTHVIVEALWVVPEKFDVLTKLHPNVKWIIRNHSEIPFVANEGIAMQWLLEYVNKPNVIISNNAPRAQKEMEFLARKAYPEMSFKDISKKVVYLPNYYPVEDDTLAIRKPPNYRYTVYNVACFGAVRPLKNHLLQAIAALKFCDQMGFKLRFHINGTRVEGKGDPILKNVRELFAKLGDRAELVEHPWMDHDQFINVCAQMDMGLQVSFSETFNIVAADLVSVRVPVVGTTEIPWMPTPFCADPTDSDDIVEKMKAAHRYNRSSSGVFNIWKANLKDYVAETDLIWNYHFRNN